MSNSSMSLLGSSICPAPFVEASKFPNTGGFIPGRFCAPMPDILGGATCCLPCPQTNWVYSDKFGVFTDASNYINVVGLACCVFLFASFVTLPVEKTHRHYLSISLVLAVSLMQLAFIIPLGTRPKQCHDQITPNDMYSDVSCAVSGALLLAGGLSGIMWVLLRALTLHLQICWQVVTGRKFFFGAQLIGWGVPALMGSVALKVTGVSYRFGDTCHINHARSIQDFWGPVLALSGAGVIIQFATFGYCLKVYLQSLMEGNTSTIHSTGLPSYDGSTHTASARQAYNRVRRVIQLQWRGIAIVILILADVIFFSTIFVYLDNTTQESHNNLTKAEPWLFCLILHQGDKNKCLDLAAKLVVGEATVMAVLILLSMNGIWCVVLLGRLSMLAGWRDLLFSRFLPRSHDFASFDARRLSSNARTYEMLKKSPLSGIAIPQDATIVIDMEKRPQSDISSDVRLPPPVMSLSSASYSRRCSETALPSRPGSDTGYPSSDHPVRTFSPGSGRWSQTGEPATEERQYASPHLSFSSPRVPTIRSPDGSRSRTISPTPASSTAGVDLYNSPDRGWDLRPNHAKPSVSPSPGKENMF